jgi:hypothetical protein
MECARAAGNILPGADRYKKSIILWDDDSRYWHHEFDK